MYFVSCIKMRCFLVLVWICSPTSILGYGIQLEGLIDLGPNWGYKYKLYPLSTELLTELPKSSYFQKVRKDMELTNVGAGEEKDQTISPSGNIQFKKKLVNRLSSVTQITSTYYVKSSKKDVIKKSDVQSQTVQKFHKNSDDRLKKKKNLKSHNDGKSNESDKDISNGEVKEYSIGHDNIKKEEAEIDRLCNFMKHVNKESLKVWNKIQRKAKTDAVKIKVNTLKTYFKEKFQQFMDLFKMQKIKTKLGSQKVVFNTIETSNRIMLRLVNSLSIYENSINGGYSVIQQEVEKEKQLQYAHACKKIGVCRTNDDFSDFVIELIKIILQTDNAKIKQAADALIEVVKTNDFTRTIDHSTQHKLRKQMQKIELWGPFNTKSMFVILRNVLSHKNQPMVLMDPIDQELSNKTVAFHEIIDTLNKNIYKSDNIRSWNEIKKLLEEWRDGIRYEVQSVFHSLIELIKKGLEKINTTTAQDVDKNMNIVLTPLSRKKIEI